jgi:hypothetical protein
MREWKLGRVSSKKGHVTFVSSNFSSCFVHFQLVLLLKIELCELILIRSLQDHNCALHINGTVYCWGRNNLGQTGGQVGQSEVGRYENGIYRNGVPVQVLGLIGSSGVVSVVLGEVCSFSLYVMQFFEMRVVVLVIFVFLVYGI